MTNTLHRLYSFCCACVTITISYWNRQTGHNISRYYILHDLLSEIIVSWSIPSVSKLSMIATEDWIQIFKNSDLFSHYYIMADESCLVYVRLLLCLSILHLSTFILFYFQETLWLRRVREVLLIDSLSTSRPITLPVATNIEIAQQFDPISYRKVYFRISLGRDQNKFILVYDSLLCWCGKDCISFLLQ